MSDNADTTPETVEAPEQSLDDFEKELFGSDTATAKAEETEAEEEVTDEVDTASEEEETPPEDDSSIEETDEADEDEEDAPKPQKKNRAQERIEELNAKYREEERKRIELEIRLEELRKSSETKEEPKPTPPRPQDTSVPDPEAKNEDGTKKYPLGNFDPDYITDLTKYTMAQERAALEQERRQAEVRQAQEQIQSQWNEQLDSARERHPDFQEKGQALIDSFADLDNDYAEYLTTTIQRMDNGTEVLYHLASDPELAHAIVAKGPALAGVELGRISAGLEGPASTPSTTKVTKAPAPPPRVKGTGTPRKKDILENLDDFESEFFKR